MDYSKMKQAQTQTKSNVKNLRRIKAMKTEARLRTALYYSFQLLVDTFIILVFIKGFSMSYNFGHDVFFDIAKNPKNTEYVYVSIAPDSSTKTIADYVLVRRREHSPCPIAEGGIRVHFLCIPAGCIQTG